MLGFLKMKTVAGTSEISRSQRGLIKNNDVIVVSILFDKIAWGQDMSCTYHSKRI